MEFLSKSQKEHSLTSTWKQTLPKEQLKEELRQQLILKVSKGLSNHFSTFFSCELFFWKFEKFFLHTHTYFVHFYIPIWSAKFVIFHSFETSICKEMYVVVRNFLHRKINLEIVHFRIYFNQSFNYVYYILGLFLSHSGKKKNCIFRQ